MDQLSSQELIDKMVMSMQRLLRSLLRERDKQAAREGKPPQRFDGFSMRLFPAYGYVYFDARKPLESLGDEQTRENPANWELSQMRTTQEGQLPEFDWLKMHMEDRHHALQERTVYQRWAQWLNVCMSYALLDSRLSEIFQLLGVWDLQYSEGHGWTPETKLYVSSDDFLFTPMGFNNLLLVKAESVVYGPGNTAWIDGVYRPEEFFR